MLNPGEALEAAQNNGKLIAREGWNGKNQFVFARPADALDCDMIIHRVKSLPQAFKDKLVGDFAHTKDEELAGKDPASVSIQFTAYFCLYNADTKTVTNGWVPSMGDLFAKDWYIVE